MANNNIKWLKIYQNVLYGFIKASTDVKWLIMAYNISKYLKISFNGKKVYVLAARVQMLCRIQSSVGRTAGTVRGTIAIVETAKVKSRS